MEPCTARYQGWEREKDTARARTTMVHQASLKVRADMTCIPEPTIFGKRFNFKKMQCGNNMTPGLVGLVRPDTHDMLWIFMEIRTCQN